MKYPLTCTVYELLWIVMSIWMYRCYCTDGIHQYASIYVSCLIFHDAFAAGRSKEALQEAGRKAARTRAERYGEELKVSDPQNDDLQVCSLLCSACAIKTFNFCVQMLMLARQLKGLVV